MPSSRKPRQHRYGDVLSYSPGPPMMLLCRLDDSDSGWTVVYLFESGPIINTLYGLHENRDQMLPQYKVLEDA